MNKNIFIKPILRYFLFPVIIFALLISPFYAFHGAKAAPAEEKRGLLWRADINGNSIFLLGSIHILKKDAYPLPQGIESAYRKCDSLIFETNLGGMQDPAIQGLIMKLGLLPQGKTLEGSLSQKTYQGFKRRIEAVGLPASQFSGFKPWFAAIALMGLELQRMGFDPSYGIDSHFFKRAKQDKKELVFLEPMEKQLRLLGDMNSEDQESFMKQALKDLEVVEEMTSEMIDSWDAGDPERLNSIIQISFRDYPQLYEKLIIQRNREWKERIVELKDKNKNMMIVVGAGHLIGRNNLVEMLTKEGFSFEQQ
jgi:uncharacterized protein YbaP (TraB family)